MQDPEDLELADVLGLPALLICALRELHEEAGLVTDGHQLRAHEGPFEAWLKGAKIDRTRFMEAVHPDAEEVADAQKTTKFKLNTTVNDIIFWLEFYF